MCLAVPGRLVRVEKDPLGVPTGAVDFGGITKEVCLAYVPEACVGDYVLVHVGFALGKIGEEEAQEVFRTLRSMNQLGELETPEP
ncbi:MAG TPA: HypC/HybG/HupF family hydrogenase formation chaperone [Dongiaceae bacterium]|nr:HypC/HybG/HupF family hydrogenase formation chaperone [Dongiaceae bacterium]